MRDAEKFLALVDGLRADNRAIYLGRDNGTDLFAGVRDSVAVVGVQGSGKTTCVFAPSVACHPGPVVITSVRQEGREKGIREATLGARRLIASHFGGEVMELAVDDAFGFQAQPVWWDFTDGCQNWNAALDRAKSLARAGIKPTLENYEDWRNFVASLLAPLLFAADLWSPALTDRDLARIINASRGIGAQPSNSASSNTDNPQTIYDVLANLENHYPNGHPSTQLLNMFRDGEMHAETRQTTFVLACSNVLSVFAYDPFAQTETLSLADFVRSCGTLYITAGKDRAKDVDMLIAALLEALDNVWSRTPFSERPPSMLFALDEVATVAPIPSLPKGVGMYGGNGIQLLLGFQHSSQAWRAWADEGEGVILGTNHFLLFPGLVDEKITKKFADLAPQASRHHIEVIVRDGVTTDSRQASATRLISERQELEAALAGKRPVLRESAALMVARKLLNRRIKDGIKGRNGNSAKDLLRELLTCTESKPVASRRPTLEQSDLFTMPRGRAFLKSSNITRFVDVSPYDRHPLWKNWLVDA